MPPPEPLHCGLCEYKTPPGCPTWENMLKTMELHNTQMHSRDRNTKKEKISRPTLREDIDEASYNFFEQQWKRYKRVTKIREDEAVDQLWCCATEELQPQCHDHGVDLDNTDEETLLSMLKIYSIRAQNKLVSVVQYLNLSQENLSQNSFQGSEDWQKFVTSK